MPSLPNRAALGGLSRLLVPCKYIMAHQQPRPQLEPDQLSALWQACDSKDTTPLAQLIETLDPPAHDLRTCLTFAIEGSHLNVVRYLLERGVPVDGYVVRVALQAQSIPVL